MKFGRIINSRKAFIAGSYKTSRLAFILCESFALASVFRFIRLGNAEGVLQSIVSAALLFVPLAVERIFGFRFSRPMYVYISIHCLGSLLGHSYKLFYTTAFWDKLLHTSSGVIFAAVGMYIPKLLNQNTEVSLPLRIFCGICFSIAMSALWEIVEFADDRIFGADTQNDTFITSISSYLLGDDPSAIERITKIESVVVNGIELPGYIDIGIIDTMTDILVETLGAIGAGVLAAVDKGRHPAIIPVRAKTES